ncbi:unnamed protein product [Amoebophrya sp. A120]|nr:unnamed protein product [Amoebophrya sp. A120]|eukprot:GSA120T00024634001.1
MATTAAGAAAALSSTSYSAASSQHGSEREHYGVGGVNHMAARIPPIPTSSRSQLSAGTGISGAGSVAGEMVTAGGTSSSSAAMFSRPINLAASPGAPVSGVANPNLLYHRTTSAAATSSSTTTGPTMAHLLHPAFDLVNGTTASISSNNAVIYDVDDLVYQEVQKAAQQKLHLSHDFPKPSAATLALLMRASSGQQAASTSLLKKAGNKDSSNYKGAQIPTATATSLSKTKGEDEDQPSKLGPGDGEIESIPSCGKQISRSTSACTAGVLSPGNRKTNSTASSSYPSGELLNEVAVEEMLNLNGAPTGTRQHVENTTTTITSNPQDVDSATLELQLEAQRPPEKPRELFATKVPVVLGVDDMGTQSSTSSFQQQDIAGKLYSQSIRDYRSNANNEFYHAGTSTGSSLATSKNQAVTTTCSDIAGRIDQLHQHRPPSGNTSKRGVDNSRSQHLYQQNRDLRQLAAQQHLREEQDEEIFVTHTNLAQICSPLFLKWEKHAHCSTDLILLTRFARLLNLQSSIYDEFARIYLRMMKMLHLCDYPTSELASVLAHASSYYSTVTVSMSQPMAALERANVITILCFVGHSYAQDECCPLRVWHQYLFNRYCDLRTLNQALIRILMLLRWNLRVHDVHARHRFLMLEDVTGAGTRSGVGEADLLER